MNSILEIFNLYLADPTINLEKEFSIIELSELDRLDLKELFKQDLLNTGIRKKRIERAKQKIILTSILLPIVIILIYSLIYFNSVDFNLIAISLPMASAFYLLINSILEIRNAKKEKLKVELKYNNWK